MYADRIKDKRREIAAALFLCAVLFRILLFFTVYDDLRHGSAARYGSTALGLASGHGLTYQGDEVATIQTEPSNVQGDYRESLASDSRKPMTEFLPGTALLIAVLWKVTGIYNFAPLVIFQVLIDSLLIAWFFSAFSRHQPVVAVAAALLMTINLAAIKRTLMVGYDFWPQFSVLVLVSGVIWSLSRSRPRAWQLGLIGLAAGIGLWFRSITVFLPYFVAAAVFEIAHIRRGVRATKAVALAAALVLPVILLTMGLSAYRFEATGSLRPTRSTFWHTFFAGVGQFDNPYGLVNDDRAVWSFAQTLNPALQGQALGAMYELPGSQYESTLKSEAFDFVRRYPLLFVRNFSFRVGIMISPVLYRDGDFLPERLFPFLVPLGVMLFPLWILGLFRIVRRLPELAILFGSIYAYFFLMFGWFYVVGRVILPYLFLSIVLYLNGALHLWEWAKGTFRRIRLHGTGKKTSGTTV